MTSIHAKANKSLTLASLVVAVLAPLLAHCSNVPANSSQAADTTAKTQDSGTTSTSPGAKDGGAPAADGSAPATPSPDGNVALTPILKTGSADSQPATPTTPPTSSGSSADSTAKAIAHCLSTWPSQPFGSTKTTADVTLQPGVTVFGVGSAVDDEQSTAQPTLIFIPAAVNVLGQVTYRLRNPNGWYCLATSVNVGGLTVVQLKTGAHVATSTVDVGVGSDPGSGGQVNVGVAGSIQVVQSP